MIFNKLCFQKQFDSKLYQALVPHEGNWDEALSFAQEFQNFCISSRDAVIKKQEEDKKNQESPVEIVEESKEVS